jgi:hypothetical protein
MARAINGVPNVTWKIGRNPKPVLKPVKTLGALAAIVFTALVIGASVPTCAIAQGSGCSDSCKAAYGACYKSTANRSACEAQLQRCLQGCLAAKR